MAFAAHSSDFKDVNTRGGSSYPTGNSLTKDKTSSTESVLQYG
jgi:hypothetical protein